MSVDRTSKCRRDRAIPEPGRGHRLTDRDRAIIASVARHGAASRSQLIALGHFSSISRANRRLRELFDGGYLRRTQLATTQYAAETIYILGPKGSMIAAEATNLDPTELARQACRNPERMCLEHRLAAVKVWIATLEPPEGVRVAASLSEPECRHEYYVGDERKRVVKPDGFVLFEVAGMPLPAFLEVDRGHVSLPRMAQMFGRYDRYLRQGAFACAYSVNAPFQVLVITTAGDRRISHLAELAKTRDIRIRFATFDDLDRQGFFGRIWRRTRESAGEFLWAWPEDGFSGERL